MSTRTLALATALSLTALTAAMAQTTSPAPAVLGAGAATTTTQPASPGAAPPAASVPGTTGSTGTVTPLGSAVRQLTVDALEDMDLMGADDRKIGDVGRVVESNADKRQFVVIERGGFLGFGAKEIAIPVGNVAVQGDKVVLRNMDMARLDGMPEYKNENGAFRELDDAQPVGIAQQ